MLTRQASNTDLNNANLTHFVLRYRCLECGDTVKGTHDSAGQLCCNHCQAPLDEDDQIAQPASARRFEPTAAGELG